MENYDHCVTPAIFLPRYECSESSSLSQPQLSQEKYRLAAKTLEISDVEAYLKKMRLELKYLSEKWKNDFLNGKEINSLGDEIRDFEEPVVEVDVDDGGKIFATVECVLCNRNIRIGFSKYKTSEGMQHRFNKSNFNIHFRNHFRE